LAWAGRYRKTGQPGEVVGVVGNSKDKGLTLDPRPAIYLPLLQQYTLDLTLYVRTASDPRAIAAAVRREIQSLDATLPVYGIRTLEDQKNGSLHTERIATTLLTLFSVLALLLAAVGIYGVLSYAVAARTREIGIRLAQGAQKGDVFALILTHGMMLTMIGLIVGVGAALAVTRVMRRLLFGVSVTDPVTFAVFPVLFLCVALIACWLPARRATRVDPLAALRSE
jgi:putative ABC transport system permease protein